MPPPKAGKAVKKASRARVTEDMSGESRALFDRLREKRLELARIQNLPPYVIFHDKTLIEMAGARPTTRDAMARIPGVGSAKLDRYARRVSGSDRRAWGRRERVIRFAGSLQTLPMSFPRKRESGLRHRLWIPAFAGMTITFSDAPQKEKATRNPGGLFFKRTEAGRRGRAWLPRCPSVRS